MSAAKRHKGPYEVKVIPTFVLLDRLTETHIHIYLHTHVKQMQLPLRIEQNYTYRRKPCI